MDARTQFARGVSRKGFSEERLDVLAAATATVQHSHRQTEMSASLCKSPGILLPIVFVEIHRLNRESFRLEAGGF